MPDAQGSASHKGSEKTCPYPNSRVAESPCLFLIASGNPQHQEMHEEVLQSADVFIFIAT